MIQDRDLVLDSLLRVIKTHSPFGNLMIGKKLQLCKVVNLKWVDFS